jgi:predicted NACHT family NTPase
MRQLYKWKRFWCSRTGTISLNDNGFFLDPDSKYSHYYNQKVEDFESMQKKSCLILLGEPGIGKTAALSHEVKKNKEQLLGTGDVLVYKDLNEYGDENRLIHDIFESNMIQDWLIGKYNLCLVLDSFDECLVEVEKLAAIFRNRIREFKDHAKRLRLRIACRTAAWTESLTDEFNYFWGEDEVGIYELAPLRRIDIEEAATANGLDAVTFINEIENKEVQSLASNPITLGFLINEYKSKNRLSSSRSELFYESFLRLCTENNVDRVESQKSGILSPARRLALASRIAAVMVFCNRSSILTSQHVFPADNTQLPLSMILEGEETTGDY